MSSALSQIRQEIDGAKDAARAREAEMEARTLTPAEVERAKRAALKLQRVIDRLAAQLDELQARAIPELKERASA